MATLGQLIDRCYLEYLTLPTDQPVVATLNGAVLAGATSITLTTTTLAPEELDLIGLGVIVEVDRELFRVLDFDEGTGVATVTGAMFGTVAAGHASGAEVRIAPAVTRQGVFNALADEIASLWPDLWAPRTRLTVLSQFTPIEDTLAVGAQSVVDSEDPDESIPFKWMPYLGDHQYPGLHIPARYTGRVAYVTYQRKFPKPTTEATDLVATLFMDESWDAMLIAGAASKLLAGREFDRTTVDFLSQAIEAQGIRLGEITNVSTALWRYRMMLMDRAHRALLSEQGTNTVYVEAI